MPTPAPVDRIDLSDLASFAFHHEENTRFSDTDMVGHVNNVAHVALVECGRIAYAFDIALRAEVDAARITFARLEIDFRADLYCPARVTIGARVLAVGTSSLTVGIGVFDGDRCVTTSRNVMVHLGEDGRPAPIPEAMRVLLLAEIA